MPASSTHPFDPTHAAYLSDISDLNNLHQAPLLDLLARRFRRNDIYVRELKSKINDGAQLPCTAVLTLTHHVLRYCRTRQTLETCSSV